jgi:hypothetical protein
MRKSRIQLQRGSELKGEVIKDAADVDFLNRETAAFLDLVTDRGKKLDYARLRHRR